MTLSDLLVKLVDAFGNTPTGKLELMWHQHLARWTANISYWSVREAAREDPRLWKPGMPGDEGMLGRTPEEAVRKFLNELHGREMYRLGPNGSWGTYVVKDMVTCDDVAFVEPQEPPPLREGNNEVLKVRALDLAKKAEKVFLRTYIGDRRLKGYPVEEMIDADRDGKGYEGLLRWLEAQAADSPIEVGIYGGGAMVGFRGGIM